MQGDETQQVVLYPAAGVGGAGVRPQNERPVTGLREQEFPRGLPQGAGGQARGIGVLFGQFRQAFLGNLQVRVDPLVFFIEPNAPVPFLPQLEALGLAT